MSLAKSSKGRRRGAGVKKKAVGRPKGKSDKPALPNPLISEESNGDRLLTIDQVRQFLAVSDWLVRRLIARQELPAVAVGDLTRVRLRDLREFIDAHRVTGPKQGGRGRRKQS